MAEPSTPPPTPALPEAQDLAVGMGLLVYNTLNHHWFSATDERETLVGYYALVSGCLTRSPELAFRLLGDELTVNGESPKERERYIATLIAQMQALDVGNFTLRRGITVEALAHTVALLASEADGLREVGGFAAALSTRTGGQATSKAILFREVAEDEVVVARADMGAEAAAEAEAARVAQAATARAVLEAAAPGPVAPEGAAAVKSLAGDAPRLAELVVAAARHRSPPDGGLAAELVACVRKAFEAMTQGDALDTQRGRKLVQKQMRDLEEALLGALDRVTGYDAARDGAVLREAVAGMEDELQIDALAAEYAKRLKAMEQTEKRLLRYLKSHGGEAPAESALGTRLLDEGVAPDRWGALLAQTSDPAATTAQLGALLDQLERAGAALQQTAGGGIPQQQLDRALTSVQTQVGTMVAQTAQKIQNVTAVVQADAQAAAAADEAARRQGIGLKLTRKKLLELLAEIVQELCQPLAVINCSVDMIQSRMLGELSTAQLETLKLVSESSAKLQQLVNGLQKVAGVPDTMSPDRELLKRVVGP